MSVSIGDGVKFVARGECHEGIVVAVKWSGRRGTTMTRVAIPGRWNFWWRMPEESLTVTRPADDTTREFVKKFNGRGFEVAKNVGLRDLVYGEKLIVRLTKGREVIAEFVGFTDKGNVRVKLPSRQKVSGSATYMRRPGDAAPATVEVLDESVIDHDPVVDAEVLGVEKSDCLDKPPYEIRLGKRDARVYCTCMAWRLSKTKPKSCKHLTRWLEKHPVFAKSIDESGCLKS